MLDDTLAGIQRNIRRGAFANEAAVSQGIVLPILSALGWSVFDPSAVAPEYSVEGRRVDFALCPRPEQAAVFVEVKHRPGGRWRPDLYPGRADLADLYAVEFVTGWWLGTNYSRRSIAEIIDLACEVAGLDRGPLDVALQE